MTPPLKKLTVSCVKCFSLDFRFVIMETGKLAPIRINGLTAMVPEVIHELACSQCGEWMRMWVPLPNHTRFSRQLAASKEVVIP